MKIPADLIIINYHKIDTDSDIGITTRHPDDFKTDLNLIKELGFTTINFDQLLSNKIPKKPIIITFDDAYESFYNIAFPLLKTNKMTAVVYVPVYYIGKSNNWDVQLFNKKYDHMTESQIREVAEHNIEIGSHSLNHIYLNSLSESCIENELRKSKEYLEKCIDKSVISLSYPFGKFNKTVLNVAKKYYQFGVQLLPLSKSKNRFNNLTLNRINIYRIDSRTAFKHKLEYNSHPILCFKNWLIQQGSWATILLKRII